jgi:hypothetical protein
MDSVTETNLLEDPGGRVRFAVRFDENPPACDEAGRSHDERPASGLVQVIGLVHPSPGGMDGWLAVERPSRGTL